jgi:hypothetical protein
MIDARPRIVLVVMVGPRIEQITEKEATDEARVDTDRKDA